MAKPSAHLPKKTLDSHPSLLTHVSKLNSINKLFLLNLAIACKMSKFPPDVGNCYLLRSLGDRPDQADFFHGNKLLYPAL